MRTHTGAHRQSTQAFIRLETIAIIIVIALVIGVTVAILFIPEFTKGTPIQAPIDSLPPQLKDQKALRDDITYVDPAGPFAQAASGTPINELLFEDNKKAFAGQPNQVQGTRFKGKIVSVDRTDGLKMQMISMLENNPDIHVTYHISATNLAKTTMSNGSLDTLSEGQEINIDEVNDFTQSYPESVQSIEISLIQ